MHVLLSKPLNPRLNLLRKPVREPTTIALPNLQSRLAWVHIGLACAMLALTLPAQAGILESILANKTVQQLMIMRPQDVNQENALCTSNPQVRQANAARCDAVANAVRMQSVPLELRTVMANPTSAAALRELCVSSPALAQTNYLCLELGKGDGTLATEVNNRLLIQAAGDQRP